MFIGALGERVVEEMKAHKSEIRFMETSDGQPVFSLCSTEIPKRELYLKVPYATVLALEEAGLITPINATASAFLNLGWILAE